MASEGEKNLLVTLVVIVTTYIGTISGYLKYLFSRNKRVAKKLHFIKLLVALNDARNELLKSDKWDYSVQLKYIGSVDAILVAAAHKGELRLATLIFNALEEETGCQTGHHMHLHTDTRPVGISVTTVGETIGEAATGNRDDLPPKYRQ